MNKERRDYKDQELAQRKEVRFIDHREKAIKERNKTRKNPCLIDFKQAGNNLICQAWGK